MGDAAPELIDDLPPAAGAPGAARPASHLRLAAARAVVEQVGRPLAPTTLAADRALPVADALAGLFPHGGLRRGTLVGVAGVGATSVVMALVAEASATGSWVAWVGGRSIGWGAAAELGVALERSVVVPEVPVGHWATVTAAFVDAVDVVVVSPSHPVRAVDARRLTARARERGSVVVAVGSRYGWPVAFDVSVQVEAGRWEGVAGGHGRLSARRIELSSTGRREAARRREVSVWLPGPHGAAAEAATGTG